MNQIYLNLAYRIWNKFNLNWVYFYFHQLTETSNILRAILNMIKNIQEKNKQTNIHLSTILLAVDSLVKILSGRIYIMW